VTDVTLNDYWQSSASYRVRMALFLKELGFTSRLVDLEKGEQKSKDHLALHPICNASVANHVVDNTGAGDQGRINWMHRYVYSGFSAFERISTAKENCGKVASLAKTHPDNFKQHLPREFG